MSNELWWADSSIQFVLCDAREQGIWRDIRSVKVRVGFHGPPGDARDHFVSETVGHQTLYEKWWKKVAVTTDDQFWTTGMLGNYSGAVIINASM